MQKHSGGIGDLIKLYFTNLNTHVLALGMEMHVFDRYIHGQHVSMDFWILQINEELVCAQ